MSATESAATGSGSRRPWTAAEDELLTSLVRVYGDARGPQGRWKDIGARVPGRTIKDCRKRWFHSLDPSLRKGRWTEEEDKVLLQAYERLGPSWSAIARMIPGRKDDQCAKRYNDILDPTARDRLSNWSPEEDAVLRRGVQKLGNRWSAISRQLPGRPPLTCRNRWRALSKNDSRNATDTEEDAPSSVSATTAMPPLPDAPTPSGTILSVPATGNSFASSPATAPPLSILGSASSGSLIGNGQGHNNSNSNNNSNSGNWLTDMQTTSGTATLAQLETCFDFDLAGHDAMLNSLSLPHSYVTGSETLLESHQPSQSAPDERALYFSDNLMPQAPHQPEVPAREPELTGTESPGNAAEMDSYMWDDGPSDTSTGNGGMPPPSSRRRPAASRRPYHDPRHKQRLDVLGSSSWSPEATEKYERDVELRVLEQAAEQGSSKDVHVHHHFHHHHYHHHFHHHNR